jgi:uncharacterized membrane protein
MRSVRGASGKQGLIAFAAAVAVALVALVLLAPSLYDVVDKGKGPPIVPYEHSGVVYKVRVLDAFTLYADEESRPSADKLSSVGLVAAAAMALMTLLLLNAAGSKRRLRRFYALATAGLAYLALDELMAVHETLGHNLQFLANLPGVERPDDLVFLSYGIPLAIFAWSFRDVLFANRRAVQLFAIGTVFYAVAAAADLAGVALDEPSEVAAAACLGAGLVLLTAGTLRRELHLGEAAHGARPSRGVEATPSQRVLVGSGHGAI